MIDYEKNKILIEFIVIDLIKNEIFILKCLI